METFIGIPWFISMAILVFFNKLLILRLDYYRELNHRLEVEVQERKMAVVYRIISVAIFVVAVSISETWEWAIVGVIIGWIISTVFYNCDTKQNATEYLIFFGKLIKPVCVVFSLLALLL